MIYFITGNQHKFAEIKEIVPKIEQLDIDLPEYQEIDPQKIIKAKLMEAFNHHSGPFIVEDTSLYFDYFNGLPGPLIKWFLKTMGNDGLAKLTAKLENVNATAKTLIGYAKDKDRVEFFEGELRGVIVEPRGNSNFGWNDIFQPEGSVKTFGEMSIEEKNKTSMRGLAARKLKEFLDTNS